MTDIYETEFAYELACKERLLTTHPMIRDVLALDRDENARETKCWTSLYLAGNNKLVCDERLTDEDADLLSICLCNNTYVIGLDLRYNDLTDNGMKHIARLIWENSTLQTINVMCNNFGEEGAKYIAEALQTNGSLTTLRLNGNKIGNHGGLYFALALQTNTTLESLDLADTDLRTESLIALATVLNHNRSLKSLNVSRPILFSELEETTDHFARMLKVNNSLHELHLMKHGIRDFGVTRLADNLRHNFTLTHLNLSCNRITRDGAKELADLLKCDTTLIFLDLGFNRIGDDGVSFIADALKVHNKTLKALCVTSNEITGKGLCFIADIIRQTNTSLTELYIWGNHLEESCCIAFKSLIDTGRLSADDVDVQPYVVDGHVLLAEVVSNGLSRRSYYSAAAYGDSADPELAKFAVAAAEKARRLVRPVGHMADQC